MKKLSVLILILLLTVSAFADQAAWITKADAEKAVEFLNTLSEIKHYCEPCDDHSIKTEDIDDLQAVPTGDPKFWEVKVNGKGIDLAYIYFRTKKGKWKNLAMELKIKVEGVPEFLP